MNYRQHLNYRAAHQVVGWFLGRNYGGETCPTIIVELFRMNRRQQIKTYRGMIERNGYLKTLSVYYLEKEVWRYLFRPIDWNPGMERLLRNRLSHGEVCIEVYSDSSIDWHTFVIFSFREKIYILDSYVFQRRPILREFNLEEFLAFAAKPSRSAWEKLFYCRLKNEITHVKVAFLV